MITGEFLTNQARSLVLEDEPNKAFRLLFSSLIGEGADVVIREVLMGTHELVGDSVIGIGVEEASSETTEDYLDSVKWLYAGRVRLGGRSGWYRPRAVVTSFGREDAEYASKSLNSYGASKVEWSRMRAEFYAGDGEVARHVRCKIDGVLGEFALIFESCNEPPFWVTPAKDDRAAVEEWINAERGLEERGGYTEVLSAKPERPRGAEAEKLREKAAEAEKLREEAAEAEQFAEEIQRIAEKVREQAGDDTIPLTLLDGRVVQVPRAPFTIWALDREPSMRAKLASIQWVPIAPSGIKMYNDSTHHTDWVLGAGLTIDEGYSDNVNQPAWDLAFDMQIEAVDCE